MKTSTSEKHLEGGGSWEFSTFNSVEVTSITGIPQTLQRAWRIRGLLPGSSGRGAIFTAPEVAEVLVRYQLSLNGIAPSDSVEVGRVAARSLLFSALLNSDGASEVRGSPNDVADFMKRFDMDDRIAREIAGVSDDRSFIWRADGGPVSLVGDMAPVIDERRFFSNYFLDLFAAAALLVERAGRPLVSIDVPLNVGDTRTRRLSRARLALVRPISSR